MISVLLYSLLPSAMTCAHEILAAEQVVVSSLACSIIFGAHLSAQSLFDSVVLHVVNLSYFFSDIEEAMSIQ